MAQKAPKHVGENVIINRCILHITCAFCGCVEGLVYGKCAEWKALEQLISCLKLRMYCLYAETVSFRLEEEEEEEKKNKEKEKEEKEK